MMKPSRRTVLEKFVSLAAVLAFVSAGAPPLLAGDSPTQSSQAGLGRTQRFAVTGITMGLIEGTRAEKQGAAPGSAGVEHIRTILRGRQKSVHPRLAAITGRLELWLDIMDARTPEEQHDRIRRLPVEIVTSAPEDGRAGVVKSFIARGKTRFRVFFPATPKRASLEDMRTNDRPGPSALQEEFCDDGEPGPCATEQDMEDAFIAAAEGDAEAASLQLEHDNIDHFCSDHPWICDASGASDAETPVFGPRACEPRANCLAQKLASGLGVVTVGLRSGDVWVKARGVATASAAGLTVAKVGLGLSLGYLAVAVVAAGGAVFLWGECAGWWHYLDAPLPDGITPSWFELVSWAPVLSADRIVT